MVAKALAAQYEVDGQLEQTIYEHDGRVATFQKSRFTVFVKGCSWLIRTTQNDKTGKPAFASETACVNGAEIFQVSGPLGDGDAVIGRASRGMNQALIVSNTVPIGRNEGYLACHVWLVFASGCYFEARTNNWLTPAYNLNASADVMPYLKQKAQWELIDGPGSLPRSVKYFDERGDFIEATYEATGVTNAGAIKIPSGFVFERKWSFAFGKTIGGYQATNRPAVDQHALTNHLNKRTVGTVTAVRPYCSRKDLTPVAQGKTMVVDQRPLQEAWSPTLPTNIPEWLLRVGQWDGNTNQAATLPTNIPPSVFQAFSRSEPPTNVRSGRTYYNVQDGVKWLSLAEAKKVYGTQLASPKYFPRGILVAILLLPTVLFALAWFLNRKRQE